MNIIFDLDGTLINPFERQYQIHLLLSKKYNLYPLPYREYVNIKRKLIPELFYAKNMQALIKNKYLKERELLLENFTLLKLDKIYPHVEATLSMLKSKHTLFLVTVRRRRDTLMQQLKFLGLSKYFSKIVSPPLSLLNKKPEELKQFLLDSLLKKHAKDKFIIIGDTEADILAGKKSNMQTIAVCNGLRTEKYLKSFSPDYIIESIKDVRKIIENTKYSP